MATVFLPDSFGAAAHLVPCAGLDESEILPPHTNTGYESGYDRRAQPGLSPPRYLAVPGSLSLSGGELYRDFLTEWARRNRVGPVQVRLDDGTILHAGAVRLQTPSLTSITANGINVTVQPQAFTVGGQFPSYYVLHNCAQPVYRLFDGEPVGVVFMDDAQVPPWQSEPGQNAFALWRLPDGAPYLERSLDGGTTWVEITLPTDDDPIMLYARWHRLFVTLGDTTYFTDTAFREESPNIWYETELDNLEVGGMTLPAPHWAVSIDAADDTLKALVKNSDTDSPGGVFIVAESADNGRRWVVSGVVDNTAIRLAAAGQLWAVNHSTAAVEYAGFNMNQDVINTSGNARDVNAVLPDPFNWGLPWLLIVEGCSVFRYDTPPTPRPPGEVFRTNGGCNAAGSGQLLSFAEGWGAWLIQVEGDESLVIYHWLGDDCARRIADNIVQDRVSVPVGTCSAATLGSTTTFTLGFAGQWATLYEEGQQVWIGFCDGFRYRGTVTQVIPGAPNSQAKIAVTHNDSDGIFDDCDAHGGVEYVYDLVRPDAGTRGFACAVSQMNPDVLIVCIGIYKPPTAML